MTEPAKNITNLRTAQQEIVQSKQIEPWMRQKNEPALWYMRFKRYLDMGPKRSLRALVTAEPSTRKATHKQPEKKLSDVSVPGAWKRASKIWQWVRRAEAYDLYQQSRYAQAIRETANELPYSSCAYRIMTLNSIAANLEAQIKQGMNMDVYMSIIARLQSIMRDIATEMAKLDGVTQEACDAGAARYSEKEKLEQEARDKLKNAALHERNSIVFEAEERRRVLEKKNPR